MSDDVRPLRVSMTLPGSASLGAYQAGALSALSVLIVSLRRRGHVVHVDAIGGSSAGSIVAMIFAHALTTGRSAPDLLRQAWVDDVDMELLKGRGGDAPLDFDELRDEIVEFLTDTDDHPYDVHDRLDTPITVEVGLTSLLGFEIPVDIADHDVTSLSFADWVSFDVAGPDGAAALHRPRDACLLDAVLASARHPIGLAPSVLDRTSDADRFAERHITNVPEPAHLWYTDGGLVESQPVGRIIAAARRRSGDADAERLHLVVDPRSSGPSGDEQWRDPDAGQGWFAGLRRAVSIVPTQALHDDIRSVAGVNRRLATLERVVDELVESGAVGSDDRHRVRARLAEIGDLDGCEPVDVQMITPLTHTAGDTDDGVTDLLAGDFVGAFGGFLERRIRRSDYALGWASARRWVDDGWLVRHGVDEGTLAAVIADMDRSSGDLDRDWVLDGEGADQLNTVGRLRLATLALRFARVVVGKALPSPSWLRGRWRSDG